MKDLASLLGHKTFGPLIAGMSLGAFNDNHFKNALVVLAVFSLAAEIGWDAGILVTLAGALFILPYLLFSATAGEIADRFDKARVLKFAKIAEAPIMALGLFGLIEQSVPILLVALFLMGAQSTFFSPAKYGLLPERLGIERLVPANAVLESATFLSILLGTICGGLLVMTTNGPFLAGALAVAVAIVGFAVVLLVPAGPAANPTARIDVNPVRATWRCLAGQPKDVWLNIVVISWFWLYGSAILAQVPTIVGRDLAGTETLITLFLVLFSVGVAAGSQIAGRLRRGKADAGLALWAALLMAISTALGGLRLDAWVTPLDGGGAFAFLSTTEGVLTAINLFVMAAAGGAYVVPLYARLQRITEVGSRGRAFGASNISDALFIIGGAAVSGGFLAAGFSPAQVIAAIGFAGLLVPPLVVLAFPRETLKPTFAFLLRTLFDVRLVGASNLEELKGPAVVVPNHVSYLDAALVAALLPGDPIFAINAQTAKKWWVRAFLPFADTIPIEPMNPHGLRTLIRAVEAGRTLVIFPEGRITRTGGLMKAYPGPAMVVDKTDVPLVPINIQGPERSKLSKLGGRIRQVLFPKTRITIRPPTSLDLPSELKGRNRRRRAAERLEEILEAAAFASSDIGRTIPDMVRRAAFHYGSDLVVLEDAAGTRLSYRRFFVATEALATLFDGTLAGARPNIGVMLPNTAGLPAVLMALWQTGRTPAMLNYTSGETAVLSALATAEIEVVLCSREFVERARLQPLAARIAEHARIVWMEDVRASVSRRLRIRSLFRELLRPRRSPVKPGDPAVILFTSGTEGPPKGVVQSHRALVANVAQVVSVLDATSADRMLNALPAFHSFGMTGGILLPLIRGIPVFQYPSPLHYRIVPEIAYDTEATIMVGTASFFRGYARTAHAYDFRSLRLAVLGAEKVPDDLRRDWAERFGVRLLEGYGTTETGPVLAVNTPRRNRAGTVGRLLPGIEARLEPMAGVPVGGRLLVRGPNVMLGYLRAERPGQIETPEEGWYDTGDIVDLSPDGFLSIVGRAKRIAKVAGEMIPLSQVEEVAQTVAGGDTALAAVTLPDPLRGERIVLVSEQPIERRALTAATQARGLSELLVPREVLVVEKLPLLGSGKPDLSACRRLAEVALASPAVG